VSGVSDARARATRVFRDLGDTGDARRLGGDPGLLLRRLTVVSVRSLKGRVVTSAALDKGGGLTLISTFGDSSYVALRPLTNPGAGPTAYFVDSAELVIAREGASATTVARIGVGAGIRIRFDATSYMVSTPPVDATLPWGASQRALYYFSAGGDTLHTATIPGERSRAYDVRLPDAELSPSRAQTLLREWARGARLSARQEREIPSQLRLPRRLPLVDRLYPVETGGFWLRTRASVDPNAPQVMTRYTASLVPVTCFRLEPKHRVLGVGDALVIVGEADEDGVLALRSGRPTARCGAPLMEGARR